MIEIGNTLVSVDLFDEKFVCDLAACKGACCVEGDAGAPLEKEELPLLEKLYDKVKPFMRQEGIKAIESQGTHVTDVDLEPVTPLVEGKECAYVTFEEDGTAKCAFEKAFQAGAIDFRKPVSCHLYPVRVTRYARFEALNYDQWKICKPACHCGEQLNVQVFRFVKDALVRKFGAEWYSEIEVADQLRKQHI